MSEEKGGTATKTAPTKKPRKPLPLWKVLLHNDPKNTFEHVIQSIVNLTPLKEQEAKVRTEEAHKKGVSLLLVTHKERAELYQDQFQSLGITLTVEPE
jgi:ATP-dependent Clp protease adaptor protein ClpS